jgi:NADPH2:quinone reductase
LPLLTGEGQSHHGEILSQAAKFAETEMLAPLLNQLRFSTADLEHAYSLVESGSLGKVIIDFEN